MKLLINIMVYLCCSLPALAGLDSLRIQPFKFNSKTTFFHLNDAIKVFATQDTLKGEEAWEFIQKGQMNRVNERINPGMNKDDQAYWVVFSIINETDDQEVIIEIDYPQLDYIQLYDINGKNTSLIHETGDQFTFSHRPIKYRNFLLPLSLKLGEEKTYLLNIDKRSSAIRFPLKVYSQELLLPKITRENIYYGVYFGFFLLISVLSMIIGISMRRIVFVWYSLYVLFISLWIFTRLGFSYQYLLPNHPTFNTHFFPSVTSSGLMFLTLYVMSFFNTQVVIPKTHRIMRGIVIFILSFFIIWALFPSVFLKYAPILFFLKYSITFMIIGFAYLAAIKYMKYDAFRSKMFIGAYTVLFIGIAFIIFGEYGIGSTSFIIDPFMIGFLIEIVMLTILMVVTVLKILAQKEELSDGNKQLSKLLTKSERSNKLEKHFHLNSKAVLEVEQIKFIKSDDHYLEFHLVSRDRPEIDRNSLNDVLSKLPQHFIKIHRSYVINMHHVKVKQATKVTLNDETTLPVSRSYKDQLSESMKFIN